MKNIIFIFSILIIFSKTGNVLSDNNIFNVNNIEIIEENKSNKERVINQAFIKGFNQLINRLLLEDDYKKVSNTNLQQIQKLIFTLSNYKPKGRSFKKKIIIFQK